MTRKLLISLAVVLAVGAFALPSAAWAGAAPCWSKSSSSCTSVNTVPKNVFLFGTLTLKITVGGSGEVTCPYHSWGKNKNPATGHGEGQVTTFHGFSGSGCASTNCPAFIDVVGERLPWPSELEEPMPGEIRDKITKIKLAVRCWTSQAARNTADAGGGSAGLLAKEAFVGELHPRCLAKPAVFPQPTALEFDDGFGGDLEAEGSGGAIRASFEGLLKPRGFPVAPIQCLPF